MKFLAIFTALAAYAQTDVRVANDQVRAYVATDQPHHPSALHEHKFNRVLIYLDDGAESFTSPSGKVEKIEFKAGDVRWSPAGGPHISENITDHPYRILEIELHNRPRSYTLSALDPLKVDAKNYSREFENDQVRVLRVRFAAHEKGVRHEHQLDHVVVYLTDHAKGPAGTVKMEGPEIHTEENPLDHAVERIAVDLK